VLYLFIIELLYKKPLCALWILRVDQKLDNLSHASANR